MSAVLLTATMFGACIGSFVATAVVRTTRGERVTVGRSHCDHCQTPLGFHQTAPVVSYLVQGGACRRCGGRIEPLHFLGEVGGAGIAALGMAVWLAARQPATSVLTATALGFLLLALSLYDLRTQRLPDPLVAIGLALTLALAWAQDRLVVGLVCGLVTFTMLAGVRHLSRTRGGEAGLGFGDVKLLSVLAVWLGLQTPLALVAACIIALMGRLVTRTWTGRTAFGPAIASAAWLVGLCEGSGLWPS